MFRHALPFLLPILLGISAATAAEPVRIRVLSYNIHHAEGIDRKLDLQRIARVIQSVSPDVVALQEVDKKTKRVKNIDQPAELGKLTKMHVAFEKNIPFQGGEYGNAVLSKWPIAKHKNIHLPNHNRGEQRGVLICQLKHPRLDVPLLFLCTHLDHRADPRERLASAKKINELIAGHGTRPAILAGDLNATPQSDVLKTFAKQWTVANRKERPTIPVTKPRKQIDFILHRPASRWKAVEVRVLDEAVASDHRAIFAILEQQPTAKRQSKRNNTASPNGVSSLPSRAIHVAKSVTPNDTFVSAANETVAESEPVKNRPNILLITADNLGYGDLRMYNRASTIKTPNLDRFARQGARLTGFYTASPTCTVSRACLLTGRIAPRHGLENQLPGVKGNYGVGLNHSEILIPQVLRKAPTRYATGCFGKWNIGFAKGSRPTERGFDEFIGHASGNCDYYQHNYREKHDLYDGIKELHREGEYTTDIFADAAIDFMNRNTKAGRPWFCYLPFNAPHFPVAGNKKPGKPNNWQAPDWAFKAYGLSPDETDPMKRYAAVVTALDKAIGRVLASLDASGAGKNTFVFFMSDNGAFKLGRKGLDVGSNHPLRHGGVTCWEGGLRVAALARWPGKIKPGSVISEPFWSPDLMIACAKLAGAKLPVGVRLDGKDPLPLLTQNAKSPHQSFYFTFRRHAALRMGNLKIVRERPDRPWQLFDLSQDESESTDLAKQRPGDVARLNAMFALWRNGFVPQTRSSR